jgi:hypothetical protein
MILIFETLAQVWHPNFKKQIRILESSIAYQLKG